MRRRVAFYMCAGIIICCWVIVGQPHELIKRHTVSVLKKHDVRLAFSHHRAIDRFAHRGWDLSAAAKVTDGNVRAIAKAVSGRRGMLLICGDHETHLKNRKAKQALHGKAPASVPLIVGCP